MRFRSHRGWMIWSLMVRVRALVRELPRVHRDREDISIGHVDRNLITVTIRNTLLFKVVIDSQSA